MQLYLALSMTLLVGAMGSPLIHTDIDDIRVINGTDAEPGKNPYQLSLQYLGSHMCGASIIRDTWGLTAAHCVIDRNPEDLKLLAGTVLLSSGGTEVKVKRYIMHESYDPENNWINDIALLEFETALEFSDMIQPVQLLQSHEETAKNTPVTLTGWGVTETGGIYVPDHLKTVNILAFSDVDCRQVLQDFIHESQICAGLPEGNKGQCSGDSGGPLVANGFQVGIVSWSYKPCTKPPKPAGVYTQVSYFIEWIEKNINGSS